MPRHPVPAAVREALARAVADGDFAYTANAGRPELRRLIAARRPYHGGEAASVIVTAGSQQALATIYLGLLAPGDEVVIPRWSYPSYEALATLAGARAVRADPDELPAALSPRTRLLVAGSPANPTGAVLGADDWQRLVELTAEAGCWLLADEVYEELWLGERRSASPAAPHVLHVSGLSKSLALTGLRLGWLIAAPDLVDRLLPVHQHLVTCASSLAQAAALTGLALPEAEMEGIRDHYRARWELLRGELARLPPDVTWEEPGGAFYLWLRIGERAESTEQLALRLAHEGRVAVVPGEAFGPDGRGYLRLCFSSPAEVLARGITRLAAELSSTGHESAS